MAATKARVPGMIGQPTKATTRAELEKQRGGVYATGPSGAVYKLRQLNFERHALNGGLPSSMVSIALEGEAGVQKVFEQLAAGPSDDPEEKTSYQELREYIDRLVIASVVEPALTIEDLGDPDKLDDDPLVTPLDQQWIVSVAFRSTDEDAEGRRLWGVEPLNRFQIFSHFHDCPEGCEGCARAGLFMDAAK